MRAGRELKFENYESVQHTLPFSEIKKGAKISFHRHFKGVFWGEVGRGGGLKSNDPYGRGISGITHCFTATHQTIMNLYFILNTHFRLSNLEELVVNHNELEVFVLFISRYIKIIKKYYMSILIF